MSDRYSGKWLPFHLDGSLHSCRNQTQTGSKNVKTRPLTLEEIDARLKRLESIVIDPRK
jgi:hypothetical protein